MARRPEDRELLYTPSQVAALFRVDYRTVDRWVKAGKFGEDAVTRTKGGHRRYRASAINALLRGEQQ